MGNNQVLIPPFDRPGFRDAIFKDLTEAKQNFSKMNEIFDVATQTDVSALQESAGAFTFAYNVKDYGATGDGKTDDTIAIRMTIAVAKVGGGIVFFPAGKYVSQQQKIPSNVTLMGQGFCSWLILKDHTNADFIINEDWDDGNENIHIVGLKVDGNKEYQEANTDTIRFQGVTDSTIERVFSQNGDYANFVLKDCERVVLSKIFSKNPGAVGLYITASSDNQVIGMHATTDSGGTSGYHAVLLYNGATDNQISNLVVRHTGLSSGVTFNVDCHRNKLSTAVLIGCGNGIEVNESDYFQLTHIYVSNARASADYESGIEIVDSQKGTISDVIAYNNYAAGIYLRAGSNDNVVEKVIAELNGWSGFLVDASIRNKFAACKAIKNDGRGYYFTAASNYNGLTGSDAINNGQGGSFAGVEIEDSNYCKVTGGIFDDDQTPKTQTYGIEETGTSDYTQVHGINAVGNLTGDISLIGVNSVETDNMV